MAAALAFPLGYGIYDLIRRRKTNFFSIVGILSVLLTGGLNQLQADPFWFAVKEAAIPTLFGVAVIVSSGSRRPFVRELLWNEQVIDTARVDAILTERNLHPQFERLMVGATRGLAGSFLLSAVLNYALARYLLVSEPGTEAFNAELGRMNLLSWPVIVIGVPPTLAASAALTPLGDSGSETAGDAGAVVSRVKRLIAGALDSPLTPDVTVVLATEAPSATNATTGATEEEQQEFKQQQERREKFEKKLAPAGA
jgi:hypothetical protein